ncbi:hypothetical protein AHAS_AhasUnG0025400 [Arachis hypogaea]
MNQSIQVHPDRNSYVTNRIDQEILNNIYRVFHIKYNKNGKLLSPDVMVMSGSKLSDDDFPSDDDENDILEGVDPHNLIDLSRASNSSVENVLHFFHSQPSSLSSPANAVPIFSCSPPLPAIRYVLSLRLKPRLELCSPGLPSHSRCGCQAPQLSRTQAVAFQRVPHQILLGVLLLFDS